MALFTLGINHHTAPLSVREQVAFNADKLHHALTEVTRANIVREVALACGIALATLFGETGHTLPLSTVPGVNGTSQGYFLVLAAGALLLLLLTTGEGWVRRWRARATALAATGRA